MSRGSCAVVITVLLLFSISFLMPNGHTSPRLRAQAMQTHQAPTIDGIFDDSAWKGVKWNDHFVQRVPEDGAAPTYRTEFAVLFDKEALYIAVRSAVPNRESIVSRLTRRDRGGDYDRVGITIAPRQDGRTGYSFSVNPDGVKLDALYIDRWYSDNSWDGVWEVATRIENEQWTAEFAIPLDQIRFPANQKKWEFQVDRWISSIQEHVTFNPVPAEASGWISSAGELVNVEHIEPVKPFSITPEAFMSYRDVTANYGGRGEPGFDWGLGGYLKLGLWPDVLLDVTVMPDFGQVEVDKAVLNLSAFETQFPEKRPFFLEGIDMFNTPIELFYSRRLGAAPPTPEMTDEESVVSGPVGTSILSAVKLTGRTPGGLSAGLIEGVLLPTKFKIRNDSTSQTGSRQSTPWTNAAVLRVNQELGTSSVGAMATALNPAETDGSYSGGLDWVLRTEDTKYAFRGQVAGSLRYPDVLGKEEQRGAGIYTRIGREGGADFRLLGEYRFYSKKFDPNDMGFLRRNDLHNYKLYAQYFRREATGPFMEIYTGLLPSGELNTDGLDLGQRIVYYLNTKWKNDVWSDFGFNLVKSHWDDRETRGGPNLERPTTMSVWAGFWTPSRKMLSTGVFASADFWKYGYYVRAEVTPTLRLGRVEISPSVSYSHTKGRDAYVDTLSTETEDQTIIGRRKLDELNISLDGTIVVLKNLTFQFNSQLLAVRAHFSRFRHLIDDGNDVSIQYEGEPDFSRADLILQGLMRWEYLPGCALYAVYTHFGFGEGAPINNPALRRGISGLKDEEREHLFMLKLSHRFG